jgi:hypothetical protein
MPQYIMLVNFTDQGLRGVKEVPNRQDKSRDTAKKFGVERNGRLIFGPAETRVTTPMLTMAHTGQATTGQSTSTPRRSIPASRLDRVQLTAQSG